MWILMNWNVIICLRKYFFYKHKFCMCLSVIKKPAMCESPEKLCLLYVWELPLNTCLIFISLFVFQIDMQLNILRIFLVPLINIEQKDQKLMFVVSEPPWMYISFYFLVFNGIAATEIRHLLKCKLSNDALRDRRTVFPFCPFGSETSEP